MQGQAGLELLQTLGSQLDCATRSVEQALRAVGHVSVSQRGVETRKRKRASPFLASHDRDFAEQLSLPGTPTMDLLPLFKGELRHYQLQGIKWLFSMYTNALSSILADESAEDRTVQLAGLVSCMRSKGMCGPILLVAASCSHADWANKLQRLLGDGLQLHTVADDSARSMHSLKAFCSQAAHRLAKHADSLSVPPSSLVLVDPQLLVSEQQLLSQQAFRFLVLDLSQQPGSPSPPSPCGSTAAPASEVQAFAPSARAPRPSRMSGRHVGQHQRRHSVSLPTGPAHNLRVHSLPLAARAKSGGGAHHHSKAGMGPRGHARRMSGPVTRSAASLGLPMWLAGTAGVVEAGAAGHAHQLRAASGSQKGMSEEDEDSHAQLVLSLSLLSSNGDAEHDAAASGSGLCVDQKGTVDGMVRRTQSATSSGPFALNLVSALSQGQACNKPPRPLTRAQLQSQLSICSTNSLPGSFTMPPPPAASTLQSAASSSSHLQSQGAVAAAHAPHAVGAEAAAAAQIPPWLALQSQAAAGYQWPDGPITRARSSSFQQQLGQSMLWHPSASARKLETTSEELPQLAHSLRPLQTRCQAAARGVDVAAAEDDSDGENDFGIDERVEEEGAVVEGSTPQLLLLSEDVVRAARTIMKGAGNALILADGNISEACSCDELWPVLSLLLPTPVGPLQACVQQAVQAGALEAAPGAGGHSNTWQQLRGLMQRFVLRRASEDTSLENLRRLGPECNLYDLFATAD